MRRILIATDGAPWSQDAIQHFIGATCIGPADLYVLSVIARPNLASDHPRFDDAIADGIELAQQALDEAVLDFTSVGRTVHAFARVGNPVDVIVEAAKELNADLIVLGTRGPVGLAELASSGAGGRSVAEAVLHSVTCGVLIYPLRAGHDRTLATHC